MCFFYRSLILFVLLINLSVIGQERLKLGQSNINLGNIKQDSIPVSFTVFCENVSATPVKITAIKAGKNIKIVSKPAIIAAKKTGVLQCQYINKSNTGAFKESFIVETDDSEEKDKTVTVYGKIIPRPEKDMHDFSFDVGGGLKITKREIYLGEYISSGIKTESFIIYNNSQKTMNIQSSPDNASHISCRVIPATIAPKKTAIVNVSYNCKAKRDFGLVKDTLLLLTDDEAMPTKMIEVSIEIEEDFSKIAKENMSLSPKISIADNVYNFGKVKQGTMVECEFVIRNVGKKELVIRKIWSENDNISADIFPRIRNGKDFPLKIAFMTDDLSGEILEKISLVSNDPKKPKLYMYIEGVIVP